jgi:multiple sugar transport system permease protein
MSIGTMSLQTRRDVVGPGIAYAVLTIIGICFLVPFLWMIFAAFSPTATLQTAIPSHPTLSNFQTVLSSGQGTGWQPFLNGLWLAGGTAILTMVTAALAAHPLSRYNLRYKKPFLYSMIFATGLPLTAVMVPVYALFVQINLIDSMWGTIVFLSATALPYAIWLTKNFMDTVPYDLEEAAYTDGASRFSAMWYIVLPLMLPGLGVVGIFTFILAWGNFFVPFILLVSPANQPASVTIFQFFSVYGAVEYGQLAAYSILYSVPVVVLYVIVSKYLGGAFNFGGAIKG